MTRQAPPKCEKCNRYPVKVFCVQVGDSVIDVCGRCLQQIAKDKKKGNRRDLLGQQLFPFMGER